MTTPTEKVSDTDVVGLIRSKVVTTMIKLQKMHIMMVAKKVIKGSFIFS